MVIFCPEESVIAFPYALIIFDPNTIEISCLKSSLLLEYPINVSTVAGYKYLTYGVESWKDAL